MAMSEENVSVPADNYQMKCGVTLGIVAAIVAANSISSGRWGETEIQASNEKGTAYAWYQSKSIKESIVEGQRDNVKTLILTSGTKDTYRATLEKDLERLNKSLQRYEREKKEILLGSAGVGEANWGIVHKGSLGKVKGALEWEKDLALYSEAGDVFDLSAMFLQLSMVLGSISLLLNRVSVRNGFYNGMVGLAVVGTYYLSKAVSLVGSF